MTTEEAFKEAIFFYENEQDIFGDEFNHDDCIEDIHRQWGPSIAEEVDSELSSIHDAIKANSE